MLSCVFMMGTLFLVDGGTRMYPADSLMEYYLTDNGKSLHARTFVDNTAYFDLPEDYKGLPVQNVMERCIADAQVIAQ